MPHELESQIEGVHAYFANLNPGGVAIFAAPFVLMLAALALLPLFAGHFWEKNQNKGKVAAFLSVPIAFFFLVRDPAVLGRTALDYLAFIGLLGSLYVISGGIYIRGTYAGFPWVNTLFLLAGAGLANFIGTTGASVLLIRPLLRANKIRHHKTHIVIFFIFIVSNCAGLLTPLGDPPLFLGFLNGVDFNWTLRLSKEWAVVVASLLGLFFMLDSYWFHQEHLETKKLLRTGDGLLSEHFGIEGGYNLLFLALVVGMILVSGYFIYPLQGNPLLGESYGSVLSKIFQAAGMGITAFLSYRVTSRTIHEKNHFNFGPIIEVAVLFAGIFITMVPALMILETQGNKLPIDQPWQYFWMSGILSSFLDNAPTYLTFTSLAKGKLALGGEGLSALMHHPTGQYYLAAISCGAVMMGANTYIGNGPNFMVKAIAEHAKVKMPGFFGYIAWSAMILLPLFGLVTLLFFRTAV